MKKKSIVTFGFLLAFIACQTYKDIPTYQKVESWRVKQVQASPQQTGGDADQGFAYMVQGDYVGGGIPYQIFKKQSKRLLKKFPYENIYQQDIPYFLNVFETDEHVKVITGNCFTCHAAPINGKLFYGVGNYYSDYRKNMTFFAKSTSAFMQLRFGKKSAEWSAYQDFGRFFKGTAPAIVTGQIGINPAARLAEACMKHRNPEDLTYIEKPYYDTEGYNIGSDVPPLWHVKKKNVLYYTGVGQGDFTKLLMQASVLGIPDSTYARQVQQNFVDVLAWLSALEAPKYPYKVNQTDALAGKEIFEDHCSKCHGTYGALETYPNKIIAIDVVKTDSLYAAYAMQSGITKWYNESWFATSLPKSSLTPSYGYIAPPLDGIWATAPYLHNGSVPTLEDLLHSSQRPTYWKRNLNNYDFDEQKVGWKYIKKANGISRFTYDTTLPGYSNVGHYFGDDLTTEERKAVIEYLKTL